MIYRLLGTTELVVSRLCIGTIPLGPGSPVPEDVAVELLRTAFRSGVRFVDTAELYGTQEIVGRAVSGFSDVVVATKSYAYTYDMMAESLARARDELGRSCVDVFLLHEQESDLTLRGHAGALECLKDARQRGWVRAIGLSTHYVAGVRAGLMEPAIEVIHGIMNKKGVGIRDGTVEDMKAAIDAAAATGRGIYAMKALGGGHLIEEAEDALGFVYELRSVDSVAVGIGEQAELDMNLLVVNRQPVPPELRQRCRTRRRRLSIEQHCTGCGLCVAACPQAALYVSDGRATVREDLCLSCGYCVAGCTELAIKLL